MKLSTFLAMAVVMGAVLVGCGSNKRPPKAPRQVNDPTEGPAAVDNPAMAPKGPDAPPAPGG